MSSEKTSVMPWSTSINNSMSSIKAKIKAEENKDRLQEQAKRGTSFLFLLTDWAENTSWGGVPYIVKKSNYLFKALWLLLVLTGLGVTGYQVWQVFQRFHSYPVNININIAYVNKITFPAVTLCNVNTMRLSALHLLPPESHALRDNLFGETTNSVTNEERLYTTEHFQQIYSSIDYPTRMYISHRMTDMILDCMYNGKACTTDDFIEWNDSVMGNCFTFNYGWYLNKTSLDWITIPTLYTYRTGPNYGLSVEIYLQEEEYIDLLTDMAGIKLVLHNQKTAPFAADHGMYLHPATYSSITVQKTNISRQPYPYPSNCVTITDVEEAKKLDAFVEIINTNYDVAGCIKSCYQAHVIKECQCGDPKLPINTIATRQFVNKTTIYGSCNDLQKMECQQNVSEKFAENLLNCNHCRVACSSIVYTHSLSSSRWPNNAFMQTKLEQIASISPKFASYMENATSPQNNILKFNIHFEELNYELIYETPAYTSDSIYGDVGGVFGLWLGMSFIAVFELIQLILDSVALFISMMLTRKTRRIENKT